MNIRFILTTPLSTGSLALFSNLERRKLVPMELASPSIRDLGDDLHDGVWQGIKKGAAEELFAGSDSATAQRNRNRPSIV